MSITIPAGTVETAPVIVEQELPQRVITRIDVHFPSGVHDEAYTSLFYGESQVFPYRKGEWVTGNAETVEDEPFIDLGEKKATINIRGKSPDALHDHTLIWRISTDPIKRARWQEALVYLASRGAI